MHKQHNYGNPSWTPSSELKAPRRGWVGGYDPMSLVDKPFGFKETIVTDEWVDASRIIDRPKIVVAPLIEPGALFDWAQRESDPED